MASEDPAQLSPFPNTEWTMVMAAGGHESGASPALERLCRKYWQPLHKFARRNNFNQEAAEDAVQGFLMSLIQRSSLGTVEPRETRFRSWLLAAFTNYIVSLRRSENAQKRGRDFAAVALDSIEDAERLLPPGDGLDPAEAFDQNWAKLVFSNALTRLRSEQAQTGKAEMYTILEPVVTGQAKTPYSEIASLTGVAENGVAVLIHRLRHRLRDILRAEVAQTVTTADTLDDELRYLMDLMRRA